MRKVKEREEERKVRHRPLPIANSWIRPNLYASNLCASNLYAYRLSSSEFNLLRKLTEYETT